MRFLSLLLPLCACQGARAPMDSEAADQERCAFSFAILTDTHIGEGLGDYGAPGWDDAWNPAVASESEAALIAAVEEINALVQAGDGPAFALVLGDLSDSGERSELERTRDILDALALPWLPLLGNHDVWPYHWDAQAEAWGEAETPVGDALIWEVFEAAFARAAQDLPSLRLTPAAWEPSLKADTPFVGFAFSHCGVRFVALDSNTRVHAAEGEPGVGPEAALHDHEGGSWPWLLERLEGDDGALPVAVVAHHPFTQSAWTSFDAERFAQIEADLSARGLEQRIAAFFGGHLHVEIEQEGPLGIPVVLTDATKDGAGPRIVQVAADGSLSWELGD
jgi:3',5'-cyclic AMP phosphodiesterase CpdA